MAKLDDLLNQFRTELGADFVSTDVVGASDGLSISGIKVDPGFDNTMASARFSMVMKLAARASEKLGIGFVDNNLVTTDKAYVLTRFLGDGSYFWGLAVSKNVTLGQVRILMNDYAEQLWDAIPR